MTAKQVRAAMRALTRRMVEGAPYEELTATMAAIAAMPGADELRAEIAGRRLALLEVHDRDETERERVLREVVPDLAPVPLPERVRWIASACGSSNLAQRYLQPLIPELRALADRDPEVVQAQDALGLVSRALGFVGPLHRPDEVAKDEELEDEAVTEDEEPSWIPAWPPEVNVGLDVMRQLIAGRRSYEEISEALDAVLDLPGGEQAAGLIANQRALLVNRRVQDDAEAQRVLMQIAPVLATFSARARASAVSLVCSGRPALAEKYVPPIIAELEEDLRQNPDDAGALELAGIKRVLERTRAGLPRPS
jgi:hypothetical protein